MTREEAIKVLRTESVEIGGNAVSVARFLTALDMAISALRQQEHFREVTKKVQWISVKDRLPEQTDPAQKVLFVKKTGGVFIGCYYKASACDQFEGWYSMCIRVDNVTHWMPLPEKPEEGTV